jgi:hypothetical protein
MKYDKTLLISLFAVLIIFPLLLIASVLLVRNRLDVSQNEQNNYLTLSYGRIITQDFSTKHNYLNMLIVNAKNPNLANRDEYQFLLKSKTGEILFQQMVSGFNIGDPGQVRFQFNPIVDSQGKTYTLQIIPLTSESSGGISLAINDGPVNNFSYLTVNGVSSNSVINFSSYFRANDKISTINTVVKELFSKMGKDIIFVLIWVFTIVFLIVLYFKNVK